MERDVVESMIVELQLEQITRRATYAGGWAGGRVAGWALRR